MGFFKKDKNGPAGTLISAISRDASAEEIQNLLSGGADIHERNETGSTPLHLAVFSGSEEIVRMLLDAGANPNAQDLKGVTPLNTARSFNGLEEISKILLGAGADPTLTDNEGKTYNM